MTHRRLRSWGLNTLANCSQPAIYLQRKTPYTATVYSLDSPPEDTPGATGYVATIHDDSRVIEGTSGGWGKFPDVFDPSFKATLLKEVAQHKGKAVGDPWCLGYFPGNELSWGRDETSLAAAVLASPADQPAKRVLVDDLKAKYETIERLNAAWKTELRLLGRAARLDHAARRRPGPRRPGRLPRQHGRRLLPPVPRGGQGDRSRRGSTSAAVSPAGATAAVFRTAAKYSDVISVNRYAETLADLRLPDGIDKPVVIGEFHFGALDRGKFHASLRPVAEPAGPRRGLREVRPQRAGEPAGRRHPLAPVRRPGHHRPRRRREFPERLRRRLRHALRRDDRRLPPDRLPAVLRTSRAVKILPCGTLVDRGNVFCKIFIP